MNLASTLELYAGGPGSGPTAPCPQCGPHSGRQPKYQEGDWVRILRPTQALSAVQKKGSQNLLVYPRARTGTRMPGEIGKVVKVLPAVGHNQEMVQLTFGKKGETEFVPIKDVEFYKGAGKVMDPQIQSKPMSDRQAQRKADLPEGGRYGQAKPLSDQRPTRNAPNYEGREHPLKGMLEPVDQVMGFSDNQDHPGQNLKSFIYQADKPDGGGSVVWVHRYSDEVSGKVSNTVIAEVNYTDNKFKYGTPKEFSYKNPVMAFKTLRDRYGIQMKMKDWRYRT